MGDRERFRYGDLSFWERIEKTLEGLTDVYEAANLIMSMGSIKYVRRVFGGIVRDIFKSKGSFILDAGCGPGTSISILLESTEKSTCIVGLDPIEAMLLKSKENFGGEDRVELVRGVFEALPFREGSIIGAVYSFSFRDAIDYIKSALELRRILKVGGSAVILDLGKPRSRRILAKVLEGPYMTFLPALAGAVLLGWEGVKRYLELRRTYLRFPETPKLYILFFKLFGKVKSLYALGGAVFILIADKLNSS